MTEALFAQAFAAYGKPTSALGVDPSSFSPVYQPFGLAPEIYFNYVDTDEINAMACDYKGHELVAIFSGLATCVTRYCAVIFTDPTMFPEIGNPYADSAEITQLNIDYLRQYPELGIAAVSTCPIRKAATLRLAYCAHLFLHAHEVAHIVAGHLDLLTNKFGVTKYVELPDTGSITPQELLLRRALELQADQSAALTSLHIFRRLLETEATDIEFRDADLLWRAATTLLFLLFEQVASRESSTFPTTHPTAFARWINIRMSVDERAQEHGIAPLRRVIPLGLRDWFKVNGPTGPRPLFLADDEERATEEVFSTWETLEAHHDALEMYRRKRGNRARTHV